MQDDRFLHVPVEAVFEALVEPRQLWSWLGVTAYVNPQYQGRYELYFDGGGLSASAGDEEATESMPPIRGQVVEVSRPELLAVEWGGDHAGYLRVRLRPALGGTRAYLDTDGHPAWTHALAELEAYFERPGDRR